ncbi:MAG: metal-binding protein [Candidatus Sumerlaeia bacterium]
MNLSVAYLGRSGLERSGENEVLSLKPNLARDAVAFDAPLKDPLRFREAITALHDIVISDLRYTKRDKTAYLEWKKSEAQRTDRLRREMIQQIQGRIATEADLPADFCEQYRAAVRKYWDARGRYAKFIQKHDPAMWRHYQMLMDPVITVADDVVFFECFSADESSYGCLTVEREAGFGPAANARPGTTNVDYSWDLYDHFQGLRSYRPTRFSIDPAGFTVKSGGSPDYREEKIDLPAGWLNGFLQIQSAMALPMRRVRLSVEAVYAMLGRLVRRREKTGPRAIRFELIPGKTPAIVLEPWEERIESHGTVYEGPPGEPVRVWGRRRLLTLARLLPLAEGVDVYLLGTGLPSFWLVRMGSMRLVLGMSGWTANDWTRGSAIDMMAPPVAPSPRIVAGIAELLRRERALSFVEIDARASMVPAETAAALNRLAHTGQVIYDLGAEVYRWRQVMPRPVAEEQIGGEHPELEAARELVAKNAIQVVKREEAGPRRELIAGKGDKLKFEILIDADGIIRRGQCACAHHRRGGLRNGPCRHLQALRMVAWGGLANYGGSTREWFERITAWAARRETS